MKKERDLSDNLVIEVSRDRMAKDIRFAKDGYEMLPVWMADATDEEISGRKQYAAFINSFMPRGYE